MKTATVTTATSKRDGTKNNSGMAEEAGYKFEAIHSNPDKSETQNNSATSALQAMFNRRSRK